MSACAASFVPSSAQQTVKNEQIGKDRCGKEWGGGGTRVRTVDDEVGRRVKHPLLPLPQVIPRLRQDRHPATSRVRESIRAEAHDANLGREREGELVAVVADSIVAVCVVGDPNPSQRPHALRDAVAV